MPIRNCTAHVRVRVSQLLSAKSVELLVIPIGFVNPKV